MAYSSLLAVPARCAGDSVMNGRWIVMVVITAACYLAVTCGTATAAEGRPARSEGSPASRAVFANTDDPDYQAILKTFEAATKVPSDPPRADLDEPRG